MSEEQLLDFVRTSAVVLGIGIDDAQARRVAIHLGRTAAMAQQLDQAELAVSDEPAEIYRPLPFPSRPDASLQP